MFQNPFMMQLLTLAKKYRNELIVGVIVFLFFLFRDLIKL